MIFHGLLYVSNKDRNPNLRLADKKDSLQIYLKNAETLFLSLKKLGFEFKIITNNKKKIIENLFHKIDVQEIKFNTNVPKGINFYSAHFKIDVYKYFSLKKGYHALLDLDMIAINPFPKIFKLYLKKKNNLLFNVNSEYKNRNILNNRKIIDSLKICNNLNSNSAEWYGGEFIVGTDKFYSQIYRTIRIVSKNYFKNYKKLYHQGDEMLLNSSIQILKKKKKIKFKEISSNNIITRYWSINTVKKQKPLNFHLKHSLIHLPADKNFLSKINISKDSQEQIRLKVKSNLNSLNKKIINFLKKKIKNFVS